MPADNNYNEILEEVCEKLNSIDSIKELDLLDVKNSVESIENLITDAQAKMNFQEIKEKLENLAFQVDSCNETLLKDLYHDINQLKEKSEGIGAHLENIQNVQNLSLTSAEFEEFQKQQLDLALKTNENIFTELKEIKDKSVVVDNSENLKNLEQQLLSVHNNLTAYMGQILSKVETTPTIDAIGSVLSVLSNVNQKNIKQTNTLIKTLEANFNEFKNKEFTNQISKISEIYDSLSIIHAWIEKVGFLNKSIENVYARLGANIDFDDVSEKVDIIYENISSLNHWTMKIDNVDGNITDMQSKIALLSSCLDDTKNISNAITSIKNRLDNSFTDDLDLEDLSNKMDIVYENITTLNEWANKIDTISNQVASVNSYIEEDKVPSKINDISNKIDSISNVFDEEQISSKVDIIYENIGTLNEWASKIDGIARKSEELDNKFTRTNDDMGIKIEQIYQTLLNAGKIIEDVPNVKDKLEYLSNELNLITRTTRNETESYIYTLLDIEADFLKLQKFLDDKTEKTSQDINSLKERFEELNDDISSISKRTNKLILTADDANKEFKSHLESFKDIITDLDRQRQILNPELKFQEIGEKLASIGSSLQNSMTASKNLNTAFMYLAEWIDATGAILNSMNNDVADIKLQTVKDDSNIKAINALNALKEEILNSFGLINKLEDEFKNYKNEDVSEIKSLLTGIIVQLNTALTPDIDSLNERIDKLTEENNNKFTQLELLMKEKIEHQEKQIIQLEEKFDDLSNKIDKLTEVVTENTNTSEIKDILTYITTQVSTFNETLNAKQNQNDDITHLLNNISEKITSVDLALKSQQNPEDELVNVLNNIASQVAVANETLNARKTTVFEISEMSKKLSSFDSNINKIVSYIEEE